MTVKILHKTGKILARTSPVAMTMIVHHAGMGYR